MVSSFGSNRVVVASLPFSVMPLLRSEAETDEANFCQYVYVTQLFVKEKPADFFGLAEMEDVYECTRNAIFGATATWPQTPDLNLNGRL